MAQTLLDILADFTVQLSAPVAVGDTTGNLTSITDDDGNALPNGTYGFTIDGGQSNKEYIVCTLTSTALSDVKSITRQGVSTTGFSKKHRRGAKVSVTDWAILSRMLNLLDGTTGFDSTGTPLGYDGAPASLTGNQFITANWATTVLPLNAAFNTYFEDTGSTNAIVITPSPSIGAYAAGQKFFIKVSNTNTGATTINVNGLGAKNLYKQVSLDIGAGSILANQIILVAYDGTNFQIIGGLGGGSGTGGGIITRSSRGSASISSGATVLIDTEGTAGSNAGNIMTDTGTIQNLYVRTESNSLNGNTVFTLLKNGTPTTVTITVSASTNTIASDVIHSLTVVGGDILTLQCDTTASASGSASVSFSYQVGSGSGVISSFTSAESLTTGDPVGTSSIDADNVALANWFSKSVVVDATANGLRRAAYIGSNRYAVVYEAGGTATGGVAIVEIDRDTMTATTLFSSSSILGTVDSIYVCSLGTVDKFLICYTEDSVNNGKVQVCDWDGVTVNQGTPVTVQSGGSWGGSQCCNMGTDKAAVAFQDVGANNNSIFYITVSGTVPTATANDTFSSANFSDADTLTLTQVDTNKFAIACSNARAKVYEFTAPSTLTEGTEITIASAATGGNIWLASAIDGKFMVFTANSGYLLQYCSISGTTITIEDTSTLPNNVSGGSIICIDATTFYLYQSNNTVATSGLYEVTISGGNTIDAPVLIASRVLPSSSGQLLYMTTQGYFVVLNNSATTNYFIQGMSGNFIGIAQGTVSRGGSVNVLIKGVDINQTGKSAGVIYEVTGGELVGTLDVTVPFKVIGQSSTEVIV